MLRRFHLIVAALAMLIAPIAMQSGMAMAAMPVEHPAKALAGHCGGAAPAEDEKSGAMTQCCAAMCSAVAPIGAAAEETVAYHAPLPFSLRSTEHRAFLAKLPTPPPRAP